MASPPDLRKRAASLSNESKGNGVGLNTEDSDDAAQDTSDYHFGFHLVCFLLFIFGLFWHIKTSIRYSIFSGFISFTKFLAFWGFLLQLLALFLSLLCHLLPKSALLPSLADDLSCASFCFANTISSSLLLSFTLLEEPLEYASYRVYPPLWLYLAAHLLNSAIAWTDLLISQRTFRSRAFDWTMLLAVIHVAWLQLFSMADEEYPYEFLNRLHQPQSFAVVSLLGIGAMFGFFQAGQLVSREKHKIDLGHLLGLKKKRRARRNN